MTDAPSTFEQVLRLSWKQFFLFGFVGIALTAWSWYYGLSFPQALDGIILSANLALGSILIATMTFYYRSFWEEIAELKRIADASSIVRYHSSGITLLFGATLAVFAAIFTDLLILLYGVASILRPVFLGAFMTGILLLVVFLLVFFARSLAEMQTIKDVSEMNGESSISETQVTGSLEALARQLEADLIRDKERVAKNQSLLQRVKSAKEVFFPHQDPPTT